MWTGPRIFFKPNLTFAFSGNFDLSIIMPNFIRVNRDKIQHLKHFIRNDCIPLHNGPKEGSWSCVSCVQSSTIYVSVQDLDMFQFKRVHLLTKDKTIFIGACFLKVKAMKHVQQGTHGVMGRQPGRRAFPCKIRVESLPLTWRRLFGRLSW